MCSTCGQHWVFETGCVPMQAGQKGVLVRRVEPTAHCSTALEEGDILLSFDNVDIACDGTVPFRSGERIGFSYLITQKYTKQEVLSFC